MPRPKKRVVDRGKTLVGFVATPPELRVLRAESERLGVSVAAVLRMAVREAYASELAR
jgi:hypothetical protein